MSQSITDTWKIVHTSFVVVALIFLGVYFCFCFSFIPFIALVSCLKCQTNNLGTVEVCLQNVEANFSAPIYSLSTSSTSVLLCLLSPNTVRIAGNSYTISFLLRLITK